MNISLGYSNDNVMLNILEWVAIAITIKITCELKGCHFLGNIFLKKYLPGVMSAVILTSTVALSLPKEISAKDLEGNILIEKLNVNEDTQIQNLFSQNSDFYKFLEGLENLPTEIANKGTEEIAKWLTEETSVTVVADGENLVVPSLAELGSELGNFDATLINNGTITTMGAVDCAIAIGLMIGTVGFPVSKLLKLKQAIDHLGGITKTVDRIYTQYKKLKSENWRTVPAWQKAVTDTGKSLPGDVLDAFLDFFNITNVINQCAD